MLGFSVFFSILVLAVVLSEGVNYEHQEPSVTQAYNVLFDPINQNFSPLTNINDIEAAYRKLLQDNPAVEYGLMEHEYVNLVYNLFNFSTRLNSTQLNKINPGAKRSSPLLDKEMWVQICDPAYDDELNNSSFAGLKAQLARQMSRMMNQKVQTIIEYTDYENFYNGLLGVEKQTVLAEYRRLKFQDPAKSELTRAYYVESSKGTLLATLISCQ